MAESNPPWKLSLMAPNQRKKMSPSFPQNWRRHRRGTCKGNGKVFAPQKRQSLQTQIKPSSPTSKKHDILIMVYVAKATMYSDQTGIFPAVSSEGNKYVMVLHDVDSNLSWAEPMRNQTGGELILARNRTLTRMQQ